MTIGSACRCALAAVTATRAVRLRSARNAARFLPLNIGDPPFVSLCRREGLKIELTREGSLAASLRQHLRPAYFAFTAALFAVNPAIQEPTHGAGAKYAAHEAAFRGVTATEAENFAVPGAVTRAAK